MIVNNLADCVKQIFMGLLKAANAQQTNRNLERDRELAQKSAQIEMAQWQSNVAMV